MIRRAALLIVVTGCAASAPLPRPPEAPPAQAAAVDDAAPTMLDAMRDRMICHGPCPPPDLAGPPSDVEITLSRAGRGYVVKVRTDGRVVFEGCPGGKKGRVVEHVDPAEAQALVRRFEGAGARFDALGMSMAASLRYVTDMPASSLTLTRGRRRLTILEPAAAPFALADAVERTTRADRWTHRCSAAPPLLP